MQLLPQLQQLLPLTLWVRKPVFVAGILLATGLAQAQIAVTQITTSSTNQSDQKINGATFSNETVAITTFKDAAGNIYDANTVADSAYIRRNTGAGNSNNTSTWYTEGSKDFAATYATSYSSLLLGNNILRGSDNTFANGTGTGAATGNVERLDFLFSSSGITSTLATAFAVFDRGAVGAHDNVKIAVITGWDSVNNVPTSYGGWKRPTRSRQHCD